MTVIWIIRNIRKREGDFYKGDVLYSRTELLTDDKE